ncbi:MAG: hydrogenase nickel incorporation protein HypB [Phycisphaerales bacterium]|nr:hydrogenase nickel incorporation protein HypB [Phycisphaerales bacterium]MCB9854361.1 hydrogenase nickel incorporation protein HypB [Phycisphaerales bacterium]MCB9863562.1 hydrogenase nickel incorporation protein HypB [Phycisphaerales bacterium]
MKIEVLRNVFEKNDQAAEQNRSRFDRLGVSCINLLGGAGSGKTSLLESLIPRLSSWMRVGVLEGDLATTSDAERIGALGVPVVQLLTDGGCHLNATLVQHGMESLLQSELDLLIIENVGNPICPANFDLGEHLRISVLSVCEGDDKPQKYPLLFKHVGGVLISKCDLLPHVEFDVDQAEADIRTLNPSAKLLRTSARSGAGIADAASWIRSVVERQPDAVPSS